MVLSQIYHQCLEMITTDIRKEVMAKKTEAQKMQEAIENKNFSRITKKLKFYFSLDYMVYEVTYHGKNYNLMPGFTKEEKDEVEAKKKELIGLIVNDFKSSGDPSLLFYIANSYRPARDFQSTISSEVYEEIRETAKNGAPCSKPLDLDSYQVKMAYLDGDEECMDF